MGCQASVILTRVSRKENVRALASLSPTSISESRISSHVYQPCTKFSICETPKRSTALQDKRGQNNTTNVKRLMSSSNSIAGSKIVRCYSDDSSSKYPEHHIINLPALSPTMEMGTIVSWEKKEGDQVSEGDLLCEIETDKATMGFETPEEGYLAKIILPAGSKDIPIGRLLCIITANEEDVQKFKDCAVVEEAKKEDPVQKKAPSLGLDEGITPKMKPLRQKQVAPPTPSIPATPPPSRIISPPPTQSAAPSASSTVQSYASGDRPFASPAAKKLAAEKSIDLFSIKAGSGMDGMITSRDVESFLASAPVAAPTPIAPAPTASAPMASPGGALPPMGAPKTTGGMPALMGSGHSDADITNMRRVIAKRLQSSKLEVPHYYLTVDIEMDAVMQLRANLNSQYEKEGVKLSVNDFIIKATALSCRRVPAVNSAWMDTFIREHHTCDVSVAVDTGSGLITPIVTSAEAKGLSEISYTIKELARRAKEGKLQPHEFQGGSITVSNLGMFGISHFTAIINSPQSCILAVGGTKDKVVPTKDGSKTAKMMSVTLSCDHRVVDGAVGAQWLQHFKKFLEQPTSMLL